MDDIFKNSGIKRNTKICKIEDLEEDKAVVKKGEDKYLPGIITVSYTHLTLPTIYSV